MEIISPGHRLELAVKLSTDSKPIMEGKTGFILRHRSRTRTAQLPGNTEIRSDTDSMIVSTFPDQPRGYARVSGDVNPIQTHPLLAKLLGFSGTVLHGSCLMSMILEALLKKTIHNDIRRLRSLD